MQTYFKIIRSRYNYNYCHVKINEVSVFILPSKLHISCPNYFGRAVNQNKVLNRALSYVRVTTTQFSIIEENPLNNWLCNGPQKYIVRVISSE